MDWIYWSYILCQGRSESTRYVSILVTSIQNLAQYPICRYIPCPLITVESSPRLIVLSLQDLLHLAPPDADIPAVEEREAHGVVEQSREGLVLCVGRSAMNRVKSFSAHNLERFIDIYICRITHIPTTLIASSTHRTARSEQKTFACRHSSSRALKSPGPCCSPCSAFHVNSRDASARILMSISRSATLCRCRRGTAPPRVSVFANRSEASNAARMIPTERAPTRAADVPNACSTMAVPVPGAASRFSSGTRRFVKRLCGPEVAVRPVSSGSRRTVYAPGSFWAMTSGVTMRMRMAAAGSAEGSWGELSWECRQTTHWRSAPRPSQPPLLVVQSC